MSVTKRSDKGSSLTYSEMDANFDAIAPRTSANGSIEIPRGTTAERDASPLEGYLRFNTTTKTFEGFQGTTWAGIGSGGGGGAQGTQGFTGNTGIQGTDGAQGTDGLQGFTGLQGNTGIQGTDGESIQGITGIQGSTGMQGFTGIQGDTGAGTQGIQGTTGIQGDTGSQGTTGSGTQGVQGTQGDNGPQGVQGTDGSGSQGIQGTQGANGNDGIGSQGTQGVDGSQGTQGLQGELGSSGFGAQGVQGITGLQGLDGPGGTGAQGIQGPAGSVQGIQGPGGPSGDEGPQGTQGISGSASATGVQGFQGPQGPLGPQGTTGAGAQGVQGVQGDFGGSGPQGVQGPGNQGVQGIQGNLGIQGTQGVLGNQGITGTGAQGFIGETGAQGARGIQGTSGTTGDQGLQGNQGTTGAQGFTGAQGVQGVQGIQGLLGNQGTKGDQGNQGIQGTIGIQGDVGIQGNDGPIGPQGIQGIDAGGSQGIQGTTGFQGFTGDGGPDGDPGAQGVQGIQGTTGIQGFTGNQGVSGNVGTGLQGTQGPQGTQGIQGTTGIQGFTGIQGNTGAQGITGSTGAQGVQGIQGNLGIQGTTGTGVQGTTGTGVQGLQGITGSAGASDIVNDTSPQLGGHLDVNGYDITSASNGAIDIKPNGSGDVFFETTTSSDATAGMVGFKKNLPNNTEKQNLGSHGLYVYTNSTSSGIWSSIGLHPGTDTSPSVNTFSYIRATRKSNYTADFKISNNGLNNRWDTIFYGDDQDGNVKFPGTVQLKSMSDATRDALTVNSAGMIIWNSTDGRIQFYDGSNWKTAELVDDPTPTLGGNLDANDKVISDIRGLNVAYNATSGSYPYLNFYQNDGSNTYQGNNQELGRITFRGLDANDNSVSLAAIKSIYEAYTPTRDARMEFMVTDANANRTVLTLNSSADTGVEVEDGENLTLTASTIGVDFPDSSGTRSLRFKRTALQHIALTPETPSASRTITVPDATGTMALTSDIPSNTSDLTNDSGFITELLDDISPQLGGGLFVNNHFVYFSDDDQARFGNGYDVKIYYDSTANEGKIVGVGANGNISIESKNVFVSNTTIEGMYSVSSHMPAISSANGTVTHDITTGSVFYHSGMTDDFTVNFTNVPTDNNRSLSVSLIMTQGATAYMPTAVQIAGTGQTISWAGGSVPTGTANKKDVVNFTLIRNSSSWEVIGIANSYEEPFDYTITTATADFNGPYHDLRPVTVTETSGDNTWYEYIEGFNFNSNGTILIARLDDGHFHRWNLSTGYDVTTATYANRSNLSALNARAGSTTFVKPDGTELYSHTGTLLAAYTMSTAWDVTTLARNTSKDLTTSSLSSGLYGIEFSSDGTKLYIANRGSTNILYELSLSTAWNPSTASLTPTHTLTAASTEYFQGISFKPDGTSFHIFDGISDDVHKYSLSTAWDLSTASFDASQAMEQLTHGGINGLRWNSDGSKAIIASNHAGGPGLYTFDVNTNYDAASSSSLNYTTYFSSGDGFTKLYSLDFSYGFIREMRFNNDGTKLFFHTSSTAGKLYEIDLTTGWDLSTAQTGSSTSSGTVISSQLTGTNSTFEGFFFNTDGTKLYVADINSATSSPRTYYLREFNLSTAFDISTLSYSTAYSWTDNFNAFINSIDINPDGTKLVVLYSSYDIVYFDLTTGWDFSTLTNQSTISDFSNLGAVGANNVSCRFSHDGTKFYMNDVQNLIYEYKLTTAYDISTLVNQGSFRTNATQDALGLPANNNSSGGQTGIHFKPDGSKMFYASRYRIYSYSVPTGTASTATSAYTATAVITDQSLSGSTSVNLNNIPDYEWIVVEIKGPASSTGGGNVGAYLRIDTTNASYSSSDYTVTSLYSIGSPYEVSGKYVWSAPVGDTIDDWIVFNPLKAKIVQANGYNNGSYETNYTNEYQISSHAKAKSMQIYNPYGTTWNAGTVSVTVYSRNS